MKVVVIGSTGTIGKAVIQELSQRHEVVAVGHSEGDLTCDLENPESIEKMYKLAAPFDAVVCCAGKVHFEDLSEMDEEKYRIGLNSKLMGQVNLVQIGINYISKPGSFTLVSGILSCDPIKSGTSASMVNAAIDGFVKGASIELPAGVRINAVSPTILEETYEKLASFFRGFDPVPAHKAALAFSKSVEGNQTGQIYCVGY